MMILYLILVWFVPIVIFHCLQEKEFDYLKRNRKPVKTKRYFSK